MDPSLTNTPNASSTCIMKPKKVVASLETHRLLADLAPERRARLSISIDATRIEDPHEASNLLDICDSNPQHAQSFHEHMGKEMIVDITKAREAEANQAR